MLRMCLKFVFVPHEITLTNASKRTHILSMKIVTLFSIYLIFNFEVETFFLQFLALFYFYL